MSGNNDKRGIDGRALARVGNPDGAPKFLLRATTEAGTLSQTVVAPADFPLEIVSISGFDLGGGGVTAVSVEKNGVAIASLTPTATLGDSLAATLSITAVEDLELYQGDELKVVTDGTPLVKVNVECVRVSDE